MSPSSSMILITPICPHSLTSSSIVLSADDKVSVKIFDNYTAFATRAEGMNNIAAIEKNDTKRHEEGIKQILLNISLYVLYKFSTFKISLPDCFSILKSINGYFLEEGTISSN